MLSMWGFDIIGVVVLSVTLGTSMSLRDAKIAMIYTPKLSAPATIVKMMPAYQALGM
jgi:hypothetical protein